MDENNLPKIELWLPRNGQIGLEPIEVVARHISSDGGVIETYGARPVGFPGWKLNMNRQVLTSYYRPATEAERLAWDARREAA